MGATAKPAADVGLWLSFGAALRLIVGWLCVAIGLLNLLAEADLRTGADVPFLIFNVVLVAGGIMLLALSWLVEDPGLLGYAVGGAVATIGLVSSTVPVIDSVCCMAGFDARHGFPFTFLARDEGWHVDSLHLVVDLLFWGFAGLLALVAVSLVRRVTSRNNEDPPLPAGKTVGGLP